MATLEQIGEALKRASAAGDTAAATTLAKAYKAMAAQSQPIASPKAEHAPNAAPQPGPLDFISQGMSGVNEGIANILGVPVDLTSAGINLLTTGVNNLTGTQIPQITNPALGSGTFKQLLSPTIKPESDNPWLQGTRRIGQEVGAMAIPGMGAMTKAAKPAQLALKELTAAVGSGTGAAIAQQVAPGNPWAEMAGQFAGGMTPGGLARLGRKAPKPPTIDDLYAQKNAAYKAVDEAGVSYAPTAYDDMLIKTIRDVKGQNISPTRHAAAYSFLQDMAARRGKPMTLTELDQLRQEVRRDLITPSYGNPEKAADAHFGNIILDNIDEMIATNKSGSKAIEAARAAHSTLRKSELLDEALIKAKRRAESTGSGGNINNAIRQNIRAILDNPRRAKAFTATERALMENLVKQGKMEDLLRLVGKLSPSGNGLMAALGIAGALYNPALGAASLAGLGAKTLADRGTLGKAANLQNVVARGTVVPPPPWLPSPGKAALLAAQGANQIGR